MISVDRGCEYDSYQSECDFNYITPRSFMPNLIDQVFDVIGTPYDTEGKLKQHNVGNNNNNKANTYSINSIFSNYTVFWKS